MSPSAAEAFGTLEDLARASLDGPTPERPPGAGSTLGRLFGARMVNEGHELIKLEVPHLVGHGATVPITVQVDWAMVMAKAVARLYVIADGQPDPLALITLLPDLVPPHVRLTVPLETATTIRAVVECGDGTLVQAQRWVWVLPPDSQSQDRPLDHPEGEGGRKTT